MTTPTLAITITATLAHIIIAIIVFLLLWLTGRMWIRRQSRPPVSTPNTARRRGKESTPTTSAFPIWADESVPEFLQFACAVCDAELSIPANTAPQPGEVAVVECEQCRTKWAAYLPSVIISQVQTSGGALDLESVQQQNGQH